MVLECGWRHAQKRWSWEFKDFEKTASWGRPLKIAVEFFGSRPAEIFNTTRCGAHCGWGQRRMVSIGFKKLCLSPRVAKDRSQKLINPFVSETTESASLPGSGRIDSAVWMHYLDTKKMAGEEARRQLHQNAASSIERVLAATSHKAPTIRPPAFHHENYPS